MMEDIMKHLPLSLAGALLLAGSMAVYAQQPPKEPMVEEQKPAQGARKPQPSSEEQKPVQGARKPQPSSEEQKPVQGARKPQPSSEEGQGERAQSGQSGQSDDKSSQDNQRSERPEKSGTAEGTAKQGRDQDSTGAASQDGQRAQQGGDRPKGESGQKHAGKKLEAKQRTVVKETIVKRNVRPVKVNFSINVGATIPRSVTLYDLPPTLIEYEPSYSRYKFVLADDDTILVIDPETWTIVDVIDI
jgi:type IV secretory pathway VirB10-like protein